MNCLLNFFDASIFFSSVKIPWGIRRLLNFIKEEYGNPPIIITENGFSEEGSSNVVNDWWRKNYYFNYLNEILKGDLNFISFPNKLLRFCRGTRVYLYLLYLRTKLKLKLLIF